MYYVKNERSILDDFVLSLSLVVGGFLGPGQREAGSRAGVVPPDSLAKVAKPGPCSRTFHE